MPSRLHGNPFFVNNDDVSLGDLSYQLFSPGETIYQLSMPGAVFPRSSLRDDLGL